eukprot:c12926_g1_i1 orf=3-371(-)
MDAPSQEQVRCPSGSLNHGLMSNIVEISSSSEKSSTGQAQETGEEATSSVKRSTLQQSSAEIAHKKPRLHVSTDGVHYASTDGAPYGVAHRESAHFNTSPSSFTEGISQNGAVEGRNLHNDDH